jgi:hypothetical protein
MKKMTTVMATAMLLGAAMTAGADAPPVPRIYRDGPLAPYTVPNLFLQEKTAFALLEGAMQAAEGIVYTSGCAGAAAEWDLGVEVFDDGAGSLDVSSNGVSQLGLRGVASAIALSPGGTKVRVTGTGALKGKTLNYSSNAYYNKPGAMMVQSATFGVKSVNGNLDPLSGTVIKDFWKANPRNVETLSCSDVERCFDPRIPVIIDWGLQSVSKNLVPQDKWWQRSRANRSDGVFARTQFRKDRLYSAKNGGACMITIDISGSNDADFFGQSGTLTISKPRVLDEE